MAKEKTAKAAAGPQPEQPASVHYEDGKGEVKSMPNTAPAVPAEPGEDT